MKDTAKPLIRAILTRLRDREGSASKTKLLKLLYLADIENFRATGETLTGFDWVFLHYGPWTADYDKALEQLAAENAIAMQTWARQGLEGERVSIREPESLGTVVKPTIAMLRTQRYIDTWADASLSNLLDYVYFRTEPMADAVRGARLDFSTVRRDPPPVYHRSKERPDQKALRSVRERLAKLREQQNAELAASEKQFKSGPYDEKFAEALAVLSADEV